MPNIFCYLHSELNDKFITICKKEDEIISSVSNIVVVDGLVEEKYDVTDDDVNLLIESSSDPMFEILEWLSFRMLLRICVLQNPCTRQS